MPLSLGQIAEQLGLTLVGDAERIISRIASFEKAGDEEISFLTNAKYKPLLASSKAAALILSKEHAEEFAGNSLISDDPYVSYAQLAQLLDSTPACAKGIHSSAVIDSSVKLGSDVNVGANAVIEAGVTLNDGAQIGAGCFVGQNVTIGCNTKLWANCTIYHEVDIGNNCLIQGNTVIGCDGFGYANKQGQWIKIPQLGTVIIGDNVEVGASVSIDRGALDNTVIHSNVIIDNQVHIAHNVTIGSGTAIAGATGIAGSTSIGRYCIIGGSVGINGHIDICDQVTITGYSMVTKSITEPGVFSSGMPAQPNRQWRRSMTRLSQIDDMHKRIVSLERKQSAKQD
ncbi:UDP-3-O-acylglucosamine N-acyltransferase [Agarivorans sp. Toyoura001]|uniref:UDP-3-O-(3-hydroxymyristoyl)glucosamine N-acyltransferase n=1 Tax=Agarivorans sp. Toyoura001 TaxID=2283141 RepID=UPI0010F10036|nr:UDP-3-O-(3-hydroxymyristoyl)glucosamine N-acyltransferase [Agarivorans sp. Toyoura001]GDY25695.1 UDP-3-O-acylglucosamine N-acyltransferase [Agarivorans sp. Toyoura001]